MAVEILNESGIEVPEDALLRMARHVYARLHVHERAETAVTVVDAARMAELHEEWMDLPGPTDVMSLPMDELTPGSPEAPAEGVLGDVSDKRIKAGGHAMAAGLTLDASRLGAFQDFVDALIAESEFGRTGVVTDIDMVLPVERASVALADSLAAQRRARRAAAYEMLADLLVDAAALHLASASDEAALAAASERLRALVRQREQACVEALLALYNFRRSDFAGDALPLAGERWGMDLFHPQALKDMGVQVGMGAAAGAMAGAAVDLLSAGLSLGTGMLIGAAAGGLWQGVEKLGKRMAGKLRGWRELSVDDAVLRLLALRQRQLIEALERRGHAAREPLQLDRPDDEAWRKGPLPEALKEARSRPEWSALGEHYEDSERRKRIVGELAKTLASQPPLPA